MLTSKIYVYDILFDIMTVDRYNLNILILINVIIGKHSGILCCIKLLCEQNIDRYLPKLITYGCRYL